MRVLMMGVLSCLLLFNQDASAETRTKVFSSGAWTLYQADGVDVSYPSRSKRVLDNMCVAELASDTASFEIVMMSSQTASQLQSIRGCPWIRITSPNWSFRKRDRLLSLEGPFNLVVPAQFSGNMIQTAIGDLSGCYSFHAFMDMAGSEISVAGCRVHRAGQGDCGSGKRYRPQRLRFGTGKQSY